MGLREIEPTLPPGFKFYPSDEELVCHYLYKKVANQKVSRGLTMVEVDLHTREPWELPEVAKLSENEWYFFSFRDRKYSTGSRANRATRSGYWKATGKDRTVRDPKTRSIVGMRKTLVFYTGRAPNGMKTCWVMHEFRLENPHMPPKEDWVLCRVVYKRKGETALSFSLDREMENIAAGCTSSQYFDSSHDFLIEELIMADGCHDQKKPMGPTPAFPIAHLEGGNNSSSPFNCSSLCLRQEVGSSTMKMGVVGSRDDEEIDYSFLLDVGLEEELGGLASADDQLFF